MAQIIEIFSNFEIAYCEDCGGDAFNILLYDEDCMLGYRCAGCGLVTYIEADGVDFIGE